MTTERLAGSNVAEPTEADRMFRVYANPSVLHGCEDEKIEPIRKPSQRRFEDSRAGRATLVTSPLIARALRTAPEAVRAWLRRVPEKNLEGVEVPDEAEAWSDVRLPPDGLAAFRAPSGLVLLMADTEWIRHQGPQSVQCVSHA